MKKILFGAFAALYALMSATSCSDTTKEIGSSLIQEESEVVIHNEFKVTGHTTPNQRIESRTIVQLLGDISAKASATSPPISYASSCRRRNLSPKGSPPTTSTR